jgi:hypothetical protein
VFGIISVCKIVKTGKTVKTAENNAGRERPGEKV